MKKILLIAFLLFTAKTQAQSISFSPESFHFWGQIKHTSMLSVHYRGFAVHATHTWKEQMATPGFSRTKDRAFAVSYLPINVKDIIRAGVIVFDRKFPTHSDAKVNAMVDIGLRVGNIRLSYVHISNAGTGYTNTGMDTITVRAYLFD